MRKRIALGLVALLAAPVMAQDLSALPDPVPLLKGKTLSERLDGAIITCLSGVDDPTRALTAFEAAGWTRADEFEGTISFEGEGLSAMFWDATGPGFCMLETDGMGTKALQDRLSAQLEAAKWGGVALVDIEGCPGLDLGNGLSVAPSSAGNDPTCAAEDSAALRFSREQK